YYVVRHAEKVLTPPNTSDPLLTDIGAQRSNDLNTYLGKKKPDSIFVSKYFRTKQTAAPTATSAGVTPIIINQSDTNAINAFITRLYKMNKKKVLVVGHTNTVPQIVKGLSGQTINAIAEADYDNMYIIKIRRTNRQLTQTTYGAVSP
ncbi:MAG: histidine phosphatase family protein, partial [Ferruginibacter sp.]|nr:histidine phosphatase family protein [Ferruginibacter sp.]